MHGDAKKNLEISKRMCYSITVFMEPNSKEVNPNMPNIKSAKKRVLVTKKKAEQNKMRVSAMKTAIKKYDAALETGDVKVMEESYKLAIHLIDQAAAKGNLKKNTASRRKSLLTRKLNAKKAEIPAPKKATKKAAAKKDAE